jgi:hypothetical protein
MKLMYLAKRNSSFASSDAFRSRWRQHGHLAMSLPTWPREGRYVHADVQPPSPVGAAHEFDGVGITWRASFPVGPGRPQESTPTGRLLLEDELVAFDGPVLPRAFFVDEEVLISNCPADFTAYLFFEGAADAEAAGRTLVSVSGPTGRSRIVLNRVSSEAVVPDPVYTFQGIVEVSAPERAALDALLVAGAAAGVRPDLEVMTRQCLLWDDGPADGAAGPS